MRPVFGVVIAAAFLSGFAARNACAQCAFDSPAKAKGLKTSMVRAYASCPGITFPVPNAVTAANLPACTPPAPLSRFQFGPKGSCTFKLQTKLEDPCSNGSGASCMKPKIRVNCHDIRDEQGASIDSETTALGWSLALLLRLTVADPGGDVTVVDFPGQLNFPDGRRGNLALRASSFQDGCLFLQPCPVLPPGCTNAQLIALWLVDPEGNIFARMGSSTR